MNSKRVGAFFSWTKQKLVKPFVFMGWSCRVAFVSKNGQTVFAPKGIIYSPETRCSAVTWVKLKFWLTRSIVDHWAVTLRCTMGQICWINYHWTFKFLNTILQLLNSPSAAVLFVLPCPKSQHILYLLMFTRTQLEIS